ncbi:hypothetical protein, partial [Pseudomonas syringae]|uniref:hypothetical protein n=1 Tax=Pseudomonas syringae TaxID=317 RepID=UPI001F1AA5CA
DQVDIRTGNHTQLDGALIASDTGNLKLDTNTLGFSDIAGKDKAGTTRRTASRLCAARWVLGTWWCAVMQQRARTRLSG